MWKFIQDNKIKEVREEDTFNRAFYDGEFIEDTEHTLSDYEQYNGEYVLKQDVPVDYKNEQIRLQRQARYIEEADPLRLDWDEAFARNEPNADEKKEIWLAKKDEIRQDLPYIEG